MGVYIDMEMPKSCDMCWALDDYGDYPRCRITEEQRGYNFPIREKRMDNCPLTPVPPHGDLVDRAEILEIAISLLDEAVTDQEAYAIRKMWSRLGQMPVYIPPEEE